MSKQTQNLAYPEQFLVRRGSMESWNKYIADYKEQHKTDEYIVPAGQLIAIKSTKEDKNYRLKLGNGIDDFYSLSYLNEIATNSYMVSKSEIMDELSKTYEQNENYTTQCIELSAEDISNVDRITISKDGENTETEIFVDTRIEVDTNSFWSINIRLKDETIPTEITYTEYCSVGDFVNYYFDKYYTKDEIDNILVGYVNAFDLDIDDTYVLTFALKHNDVIIGSKSIDLPLEAMIIDVDYDSETKELILTLKNGNQIRVDISDIVKGLVSVDDFETAINNLQILIDNKANKYEVVNELPVTGTDSTLYFVPKTMETDIPLTQTFDKVGSFSPITGTDWQCYTFTSSKVRVGVDEDNIDHLAISVDETSWVDDWNIQLKKTITNLPQDEYTLVAPFKATNSDGSLKINYWESPVVQVNGELQVETGKYSISGTLEIVYLLGWMGTNNKLDIYPIKVYNSQGELVYPTTTENEDAYNIYAWLQDKNGYEVIKKGNQSGTSIKEEFVDNLSLIDSPRENVLYTTYKTTFNDVTNLPNIMDNIDSQTTSILDEAWWVQLNPIQGGSGKAYRKVKFGSDTNNPDHFVIQHYTGEFKDYEETYTSLVAKAICYSDPNNLTPIDVTHTYRIIIPFKGINSSSGSQIYIKVGYTDIQEAVIDLNGKDQYFICEYTPNQDSGWGTYDVLPGLGSNNIPIVIATGYMGLSSGLDIKSVYVYDVTANKLILPVELKNSEYVMYENRIVITSNHNDFFDKYIYKNNRFEHLSEGSYLYKTLQNLKYNEVNQLDSDYVKDTDNQHKFVSQQQIDNWNAKQDTITVSGHLTKTGNNIDTNAVAAYPAKLNNDFSLNDAIANNYTGIKVGDLIVESGMGIVTRRLWVVTFITPVNRVQTGLLSEGFTIIDDEPEQSSFNYRHYYPGAKVLSLNGKLYKCSTTTKTGSGPYTYNYTWEEYTLGV